MASQFNRMTQSSIRRLPPIVLLALHQVMGTVGVIVLSGFICDALFGLVHYAMPSTAEMRASWLLSEIPGFPVQIFFGVAVGFVIARGTLSRAAVWVWVLPFLFLCFGAIIVVHPVGSRWGYLFGNGCKPAAHCFDQFLFTLPFVASLAYTGGAALARFGSRRERTRNIPMTTL